MKKKVMVVMLPTEKGIIYKGNYTNDLSTINLSSIHTEHYTAQHLYFISNDEIRNRDYVIMLDDFDHVFSTVQQYTAEPEQHINKNHRRVIATTDKSLNLPLIPESFVSKYVEEQGNIKEVMIDMYSCFSDDYSKDLTYQIDTRKDNTVIVSKVKDTYTKEEMINAYNEGASHAVWIWDNMIASSRHERLEKIKQDWLNSL